MGQKNMLILAAVLLVTVLVSSLVSAEMFTSITLLSSGTISSISPLHIEGRYVKDNLGQTVILKGVDYTRFIDSPYGDWIKPDGGVVWSTWNPVLANQNLEAMESWGANVVRTLATVEWWTSNTGNFRQNIADWATLSAQHGIYVDFGFWRVSGSSSAPALPYPPYDTVSSDNAIINSPSDFANMWASVASVLKNHPNIIFELWNEPSGNKTSWFETVQLTINAIRATGATNMIVVQWGYCLGVNMQYYPPAFSDLSWIESYPLNDSSNNILYSTHIYRDSIQKTTSPTYTYAYNYSDLVTAFQMTKVNYVYNNLSKPLWIGEIGPNQWVSDLANEYQFYNNSLAILNQLGIGYAAWEWWPTGSAWGHLVSGGTNYQASQAGDILKSKLSS